MMTAVEVITAKRDGKTLSSAQINWVIDAYTRDAVADEQMSALAMAVLLNGMTGTETADWTRAMIASGQCLDLSGIDRPTVDKHSTGGVGDKITLPLVPLVAACGAAVPQLSGRGLGHTGGTLDKLESIPGWRARLTPEEIRRQLVSVGAVICAPTDGLVPADRKLYALRDVTGTVESVPLIASSIMSKKIAEGASALVLDVKFGSGAFMTDLGRATELARMMIDIGRANGLATRALLTDMSVPLGAAVGNALEVAESRAVLRGEGPPDVVALTVALAETMLASVGIDDVRPAEVLASGAAYETWCAMISAQGGRPEDRLPEAKYIWSLEASQDGHLFELDARAVGLAAWRLGAGRARKEHPVDPAAGVLCLAKPGDRVVAGQPLLEFHTNDQTLIASAVEAVMDKVTVSPIPPAPTPLIRERLS
jgi:thymidine phosphorylase